MNRPLCWACTVLGTLAALAVLAAFASADPTVVATVINTATVCAG